MALQYTTYGPTIAESVGQMPPLVYGIAGGSGASTVVTIPQFSSVIGAVCIPTSGTTAIYVGTTSSNTFTVTHASGKSFHYIAFGKPKA